MVERLLSRITDHVVALTPMEARDYFGLRVLTAEKISIIHSGVELNRYHITAKKRQQKKKELGISPDSLVVGFVGWLIPIKGVTYLIKAMAEVVQRHPNSLLVLVGKCFDIFVLPSLNEGMGRVLVEAMSAGLPIVASRVGGIPDLVKHGENGLLVPPADAGALERAISDLLSDKARRKHMGETGKRMCRPYSVEAMVEKIDNLYSRLLGEHSHA
jgi:glycosyltransferase involved in cell wall biosynthesis